MFLIALGLAQQNGAAVAVSLGVAVLACVVSAGLLYGGWWLFAGPRIASQALPFRPLKTT